MQIDTKSVKYCEAACSDVTGSERRLELRAMWGVRWLHGVDRETHGANGELYEIGYITEI